jgi:hypothetical protein
MSRNVIMLLSSAPFFIVLLQRYYMIVGQVEVKADDPFFFRPSSSFVSIIRRKLVLLNEIEATIL